MKIARAPEEDILYHNTLSQLKGFWLPSLEQKHWWLLPTLANLVKQLKLSYPNKVWIFKNCTLFAWKQYV